MGYSMRQGDSRFKVQACNLAGALKALKGLAKEAKQSGEGFRYVDTAKILAARTLEAHLKEWGWKPTFDEEDNWTAISFGCESLGDEKQLFQALAPFVEAGSFIVMHGAEGETWRWYFTGTDCVEQDGSVQFGAPPAAIIDVQASEVTPQSRSKRLLS